MSVRRSVVRFMLFIMSFYTSTHFRSVLGCPLRFPCSNDVRVVFTLICFVVVHISFMFMLSCSYSRLLVSNMISISDDVAVTNQTHTRSIWVQLVQDEIIEKVLSSLTFNVVGVTQSLIFFVEFIFLPYDIVLSVCLRFTIFFLRITSLVSSNCSFKLFMILKRANKPLSNSYYVLKLQALI